MKKYLFKIWFAWLCSIGILPGSVPADLVNINFSRPDGPEFQIVASMASMLEEPELVDWGTNHTITGQNGTKQS